jgi:hypothetical protein
MFDEDAPTYADSGFSGSELERLTDIEERSDRARVARGQAPRDLFATRHSLADGNPESTLEATLSDANENPDRSMQLQALAMLQQMPVPHAPHAPHAGGPPEPEPALQEVSPDGTLPPMRARMRDTFDSEILRAREVAVPDVFTAVPPPAPSSESVGALTIDGIHDRGNVPPLRPLTYSVLAKDRGSAGTTGVMDPAEGAAPRRGRRAAMWSAVAFAAVALLGAVWFGRGHKSTASSATFARSELVRGERAMKSHVEARVPGSNGATTAYVGESARGTNNAPRNAADKHKKPRHH